jgi:hypothetical protein
MIGKLWCKFLRWRGGKHLWRDGRCKLCGRKQPKVRA